jgi:hypothetical protein
VLRARAEVCVCVARVPRVRGCRLRSCVCALRRCVPRVCMCVRAHACVRARVRMRTCALKVCDARSEFDDMGPEERRAAEAALAQRDLEARARVGGGPVSVCLCVCSDRRWRRRRKGAACGVGASRRSILSRTCGTTRLGAGGAAGGARVRACARALEEGVCY